MFKIINEINEKDHVFLSLSYSETFAMSYFIISVKGYTAFVLFRQFIFIFLARCLPIPRPQTHFP
jgi:hypothetical protein